MSNNELNEALQGKEVKSFDTDVITFTDGTELWIYGNDIDYEVKED